MRPHPKKHTEVGASSDEEEIVEGVEGERTRLMEVLVEELLVVKS